jgi:hypothetical protein
MNQTITPSPIIFTFPFPSWALPATTLILARVVLAQVEAEGLPQDRHRHHLEAPQLSVLSRNFGGANYLIPENICHPRLVNFRD